MSTTFRHDSGVLFGILLAMVALTAPNGRWRPPVFYLGVVLATMAKGPVGLLPLILAPIYIFLSHRWHSRTKEPVRLWFMWSFLLVLPAAWYGYLHWRLGSWATATYVNDALRDELHGAAEIAASAVHIYVWTPLERFVVFAPFVVWGMWRAFQGARGKRMDRHRAAEALLLIWITVVFAATAFKATHNERYFVFAIPPLAILGGRELARLTRGGIPRAVTAGVCVVALAGLLALEWTRRDNEDPRVPVAMREWVDARLADPREPIPVLAPPAPPRDTDGGPIVGIREWSLLYLRRDVTIVEDGAVARGEVPLEPFYLVHRQDEPEIPVSWRTVWISHYARLVEPPP